MDLENKVSEGSGILGTAVDLTTSALGIIGAYNLAGEICDNSNMAEIDQQITAYALLSIGAIFGYKLRSAVKRTIKPIIKKVKKNIARTKTLKDISQDREFMQRQGIPQREGGITKKLARAMFTAPVGAVLGYIPGALGIAPLCIYFGEKYDWTYSASLNSGPIAGSIIGAYAFGEMAAKRQYKRLVTSASFLGGVIASNSIINSMGLQILKEAEVWDVLGLCTFFGTLTGLAGNLIYKEEIKNKK